MFFARDEIIAKIDQTSRDGGRKTWVAFDRLLHAGQTLSEMTQLYFNRAHRESRQAVVRLMR